jgi:hypothetical protein
MRQFGQRQFSGLNSVTLPGVGDVRDGVEYGLNLSLVGTLVVDVGTGYPAESDVRLDVVYGPANEYTGTLVVDVIGPPDLSEGNLSQFEVSEVTSLDSYYEMHGIDAEYYDAANDETKWVVLCLLNRMESIGYEGQMQFENETITVLLRRYAGTDHNAVGRPAKGDRLAIPSLDGTRKYTLTQTPVVSTGQLEWKAEFSRAKQTKVGGKNVVMQNG